ncbi:MAG: adenosylcobinamide-GDP ribazoletransferase [Desulfuromonadales bacterium]|nr:adenosylcobinamide-GDP ribazoletransferase [Desulfuromonadales bacterium]
MKYGWEQFRIALGFLTVLPVDRALQATPERLGRSMALFPAAGVLLGLILVVLNSMLDALIPRAVLDCLLLLILIVITGALHLDGIADLLDGLAGGKDREGILRIMKDSRVGAMGVVGLVMLLLLKYLCLFNLPLELKSAGLIFMLAAGRWVQVVLAVSCRYLRGSEGTGAAFLEHAGERELLIASGSLIAVALVLFGLQGIFLIFLLGIAAILLIKYFEMRLGGVTGDVLGASSELIEVLSLLLVLAVI